MTTIEERTTAASVSSALVKQMEERVNNPAAIWGIPWGFAGLDALTGGIQPAEMSIVAARPKVGKSFFLAQVALNVARHLTSEEFQKKGLGERVVKLVLCEMSANQFQNRMVCQLSEVSDRRVRSGRLTLEQQRRYREAAATVAALPIEYLDTPRSLEGTVDWIRTGRRCAWWGVDYISIHPTGSGSLDADDYRKVTYLSAGFRELARNHAPGLVLSQMNRNIEKRKPEERRPMFSDLRGSGALEQDVSGICAALYRPDMDTKVPEEEALRPKQCELIVLGQRNGPVGTVELLWCPSMPGFEDVSSHVDDLEEAA